MNEPFFSVLLPTRNRSEIVPGAIQSILGQSFDDFELVISDNDESPEATRNAVAAFRDPRIRYFRTSGDLPMHDNWEHARRQALGRWLLVVEDKQRLTPTALATLHGICRDHPGSLVSYPPVNACADHLAGPSGAPDVQRFTCEQVVEEFCRFSPLFWNIFPRGLTSATPRAVMDAIASCSPTGMVFSWVNPDYAYGFQALSRAPDLWFVNEDIIYVPLSVGRTGRYSNGLSGARKEAQARKFFASLPVPESEFLGDVPVPTLWLWVNPVLYDFRKFYRRPGHTPSVDWIGYFAQCGHIILVGREWGADMSDEIRLWWTALKRRGPIFLSRVLFRIGIRSVKGLAGRLKNRLRHRDLGQAAS
ncbi:MAG: glycosyltransferase [Verrucomicrobiae bacterium]|nr:glycosyltransferase [Verrucomicrobiae bacterium]